MNQQQPPQLGPKDALNYLGEMISAYMKTLPDPVRIPVIQAINGSMAKVTDALNEVDALKEQIVFFENQMKQLSDELGKAEGEG